MTSAIVLHGEAVSDEVQLDGARHLTVEAVDAERRATLYLILDREGDAHEGDLELEEVTGAWSGGLDGVDALTPGPPLRLTCRFADADRTLDCALHEQDDASFRVTLTPA